MQQFEGESQAQVLREYALEVERRQQRLALGSGRASTASRNLQRSSSRVRRLIRPTLLQRLGGTPAWLSQNIPNVGSSYRSGTSRTINWRQYISNNISRSRSVSSQLVSSGRAARSALISSSIRLGSRLIIPLGVGLTAHELMSAENDGEFLESLFDIGIGIFSLPITAFSIASGRNETASSRCEEIGSGVCQNVSRFLEQYPDASEDAVQAFLDLEESRIERENSALPGTTEESTVIEEELDDDILVLDIYYIDAEGRPPPVAR